MQATRQTDDWPGVFIGYTAAGIGAIFCLVGIAIGAWSFSQSFNAAATNGTVVALTLSPDREGIVHLVEYEVGGKRYRTEGWAALSRHHRVGDAVRVLYKVDDPATGYIDSFLDRWFFRVVIGSIGVLVAWFGYALLWRHRHGKGGGRKKETGACTG
jgi:hypothetical protein